MPSPKRRPKVHRPSLEVPQSERDRMEAHRRDLHDRIRQLGYEIGSEDRHDA